MAEAGVKMAFGTDAGSPCVPHDEILAEMQKLIETGIAKRPLDVIQMLTVNSAELLRESENFGTVEAGKYADLLVVEGNPVANIDDIANVLDEAFRVLRDDRLRLTYLANLVE